MSKEIYISSTPHETRLAIVEDEALTEIYYERENEYTLAGSIYNGRVTRVLPGMQSSFVDIGLERDAFLYITDFMEEAPDSEEFDTASPADRPPRLNGGNGDERQDERPARSSDRGDRGRGRRGGRDRDRNQDRQGGAEPSARQPGAEHEQQDRTPAVATARVLISPGDSSRGGRRRSRRGWRPPLAWPPGTASRARPRGQPGDANAGHSRRILRTRIFVGKRAIHRNRRSDAQPARHTYSSARTRARAATVPAMPDDATNATNPPARGNPALRLTAS